MEKTLATSTMIIGKSRAARILSHAILIFMLFFLPELVMGIGNPRIADTGIIRWNVYAKSMVYIAVFYTDYYFIIGRTLIRPRRIWRFTGYNAILVAAAMAALFAISYSWLSYRAQFPRPWPVSHHVPIVVKALSFTVRDFVIIILTIGLSLAIRMGDMWLSLERRQQQLMASQRDDELHNLKSQLNPHFLFNTLNSIYALIDINPEQARGAVHRLSHLLRYVLYENPSTVSLDKEIDFIRNYVTLMEMRLGEVPVNATFPTADTSNIQVPPLLFIAIIENAFKYGNTGRHDQPITISISLSDNTIICHTHNHVSKDSINGKGGIGIANLRRRLNIIYGGNASLECKTDTAEGTYTADLTLPLNPSTNKKNA